MTGLKIRSSLIEINCLYFLLCFWIIYPPECLVIGNIISVNYHKCCFTKMLKSLLFCPSLKLCKWRVPTAFACVFRGQFNFINNILIVWYFFLFLCICTCLILISYSTESLRFCFQKELS